MTSAFGSPLRELTLATIVASCFALACGANEAGTGTGGPRPAATEASSEEEEATAPPEPEEPEPAAHTDEEPPDEPEPEPPPPEPEPVVVEAGTRLGPIRIGMTEAEVRALSLPEAEVDPRSRRFGPYRVFFDDEGAVRRIEAQMGDLERVRIGERVFAVGAHIHEMRDAIGDCQWYEGGGERYRCAGGTLFVHTTHSLDPALYTIAVERR